MNLFTFHNKKNRPKKSDKFADFFLNTPKEKQLKVLKKVAEMANAEQLKVFQLSQRQ